MENTIAPEPIALPKPKATAATTPESPGPASPLSGNESPPTLPVPTGPVPDEVPPSPLSPSGHPEIAGGVSVAEVEPSNGPVAPTPAPVDVPSA
ncbi:MAG TPA: hypothetical protein VN842_03880 [Thermoplasmata archaeon]|nr:hypothetical protein [Thermoplasmata archaeon]